MDRKHLVEEMKKKILFRCKDEEQFYLYLYLSLIEEYDDNFPAPAGVSFTETYLPKITYGNIEELLEKAEAKGIERSRAFMELIKHELMHLINLHPIRAASYLKRRRIIPTDDVLNVMNMIADSICNRYIDKKFVDSVGGVEPDATNRTFEEIADEFFANAEKIVLSGGDSGQGNDTDTNGNSGGVGQENGGNKNNSKKKGRGNGKGRKGKNNGNNGGGNSQGQNNGNVSGGGGLSPNDMDRKLIRELVSNPDPNAIREIEKQIQDSVRNLIEKVEKAIGNIPGEIKEIISKWRKCEFFKIEDENVLFTAFQNIERMFVDVSPIARYPAVLPVYRPYSGSTILIVVDTSGSMSSEELEYGFYVIKRLSQKNKILVLQVDTEIKGRAIEIERWRFPDKLEVKGRGGTDFSCLSDLKNYIPATERENIKSVVIFTDGHVVAFPNTNPLPSAAWFGITTDAIPSGPKWIRWHRLVKVESD